MKAFKNDALFDPKADSPLSDTELIAKKNRYEKFDATNFIERIAASSLGSKVVRLDPLGTGANAFDHLVFKLLTEDGRSIVCRINTDALVAKHFAVEAELYRIWRQNGINAPEVYDVSLRSEPEAPDYMLLEYVGTTDLEHHLIKHPEDRNEYARKSGIFLAKLHSTTVPCFGALCLEDGVLHGAWMTWKEAVLAYFEENMKYLVKNDLLSSDQADIAQRTMAKHEGLLSLERGVTLHGDYHNANIIIDADRKSVVAAIDLSQAKAGDPIFDLAFYGTYVSQEAFLEFCEGYFSRQQRPSDLDERIALYQLRIYASKAKLRKRFGYNERIPAAIEGIERSVMRLA